jgi:hypothetical protein
MNAEPANDSPAVQALVRAYVACRLALDAVPDLPDDLRHAVEGPVKTLCRLVGPELERVCPDALDREPGADGREAPA